MIANLGQISGGNRCLGAPDDSVVCRVWRFARAKEL